MIISHLKWCQTEFNEKFCFNKEKLWRGNNIVSCKTQKLQLNLNHWKYLQFSNYYTSSMQEPFELCPIWRSGLRSLKRQFKKKKTATLFFQWRVVPHCPMLFKQEGKNACEILYIWIYMVITPVLKEQMLQLSSTQMALIKWCIKQLQWWNEKFIVCLW